MHELLSRESDTLVAEPRCERYAALSRLVRHLLAVVERLESGECPPHADCDEPGCWRDETYLYIESTIPDADDRDIDVSVHDGRLMIRLSR